MVSKGDSGKWGFKGCMGKDIQERGGTRFGHSNAWPGSYSSYYIYNFLMFAANVSYVTLSSFDEALLLGYNLIMGGA